MAYEIYDNLATTLATSYTAGTSGSFSLPTADIPALLYIDSTKDVIFTITDGTNTCFVSCHPTSESGGEVVFEVDDVTGLGGGATATYAIGSDVSYSVSRAAVVQSNAIPTLASNVEAGLFGSPYLAYCTGNYSSCFVDQSSEGSHVDVVLPDLVTGGNVTAFPSLRGQVAFNGAIVPKTLNLFLRQNLSGGDYSGTISVTTAQGDIALTPAGTGPTTVDPVKCLRITAYGLPADTGWIVSEWFDVQEVDLSEGGGGE